MSTLKLKTLLGLVGRVLKLVTQLCNGLSEKKAISASFVLNILDKRPRIFLGSLKF